MNAPRLPERLRMLALTLHGLDRRDQAWLLHRLLPGVRGTLRGLLRELRSLGMARNLASTLLQLPAVTEPGGLHQGDVSRIDVANPDLVATILARQPYWAQRTLLNLRPWRWRETVWEQLGLISRSLLLDPDGASSSCSAAQRDALLFSFAAILQAGQAAAPMSGGDA